MASKHKHFSYITFLVDKLQIYLIKVVVKKHFRTQSTLLTKIMFCVKGTLWYTDYDYN